jgi:hypothetical protein
LTIVLRLIENCFPDKSVVNFPKYVNELCAFQAHAIAASQSHMASVYVIDNHTSKSNNCNESSVFKEFKVGDYAITVCLSYCSGIVNWIINGVVHI